MNGTTDPLERIREALRRWDSLTGQDRCHYHPDVLGEIARLAGVELTRDPTNVPLVEFQIGCRRFQIDRFGQAAVCGRDPQQLTAEDWVIILRSRLSGCEAREKELERRLALLLAVREAASELLAAQADLARRRNLTTIPDWAPGLPDATQRMERAWVDLALRLMDCEGIRRGTP